MKVINVKETKKRKSHLVLSFTRWKQINNYMETIRKQLVELESPYIFPNKLGKVQVCQIQHYYSKWVNIFFFIFQSPSYFSKLWRNHWILAGGNPNIAQNIIRTIGKHIYMLFV